MYKLAIRWILAAVILTAAAFGQQSTGTMNIQVQDSSGAALPSATVHITHVATGQNRNLPANEVGLVHATFLPVGGYTVSAEAAGFKTIVFIGDHGANQPPQVAVAGRLSAEWRKDGVRVAQIAAYYDDKAQTAQLLSAGYSKEEIGEHASVIDTSELLSVHPEGVDLSRFSPAGVGSEANGARGDPRRATASLGARLLDTRIEAAITEIKALSATN